MLQDLVRAGCGKPTCTTHSKVTLQDTTKTTHIFREKVNNYPQILKANSSLAMNFYVIVFFIETYYTVDIKLKEEDLFRLGRP